MYKIPLYIPTRLFYASTYFRMIICNDIEVYINYREKCTLISNVLKRKEVSVFFRGDAPNIYPLVKFDLRLLIDSL